MRGIPTLEAGRIVLRPFTLQDAAEVQRLAGDRAIADTTLSIPHPYPDGAAETWIARHAERFASGEEATFAIVREPGATLVGAISLMGVVRNHQAELGYWIGKPYWGQGLCTEAARAALRFAFVDLGLVRVHACHFTRNPASGRVLEKLGMRHEGRRRQHAMKWGVVEDLENYGILREEWIATTRS